MKILKYLLLSLILVLLTACGVESQVDQSKVFDMWDYMTSSSNYEVEYDIYQNGILTGRDLEIHKQFGNQYEISNANNVVTSSLFLGNNQLLLQEGTDDSNIIKHVYLGDRGVFQSPFIELCTFERFYDRYRIKNSTFYNVIQISCNYRSGIYKEFYYGYNEGLVSFYEKNGADKLESVKIAERAIF